MTSWKDVLVSPTTTIRETIEKIDVGAIQIALVIDADGRLLGTVTDGDVRRGLLKGIALNESVACIMNSRPTTATLEQHRESLLPIMKQKKLHQIPILDAGGRVVGIEFIDKILKTTEKPNWVIIMAGGLGSRLYPLTQDCPKPMLRVGQKPILEIIVENLIESGFRKFYFSVNYKAEMIKDHFGDGRQWGAEIQYLNETEQLGTAGSLSLISEPPTNPVLVINGDLLTKINFQNLLDFHSSYQAVATMCIREFEQKVPYGVVNIDEKGITSIVEKPIHRHFINAGVYVLEPQVLTHIPGKTFFDMPSLFGRLIEDKLQVCAFPIREYWLDIGQMTDFERAQSEFSGVLR